MRRTLLPILALVALVALVAVGLSQAGGEDPEPVGGPRFDLDGALAQLRSDPPPPAPIAALHRDANRLLPGGRPAFEARLRALRGHPIVVNKWASWCGPCQLEFPFFQRQATSRGKEIAFVGLDAKDTLGEARTFLRDVPVPFPSYLDPKEQAARALNTGTFFPTTVFIDERGETAFVHQGQYRTEADLAADIDRYLLGKGGA